jgi:hypothetical protein
MTDLVHYEDDEKQREEVTLAQSIINIGKKAVQSISDTLTSMKPGKSFRSPEEKDPDRNSLIASKMITSVQL